MRNVRFISHCALLLSFCPFCRCRKDLLFVSIRRSMIPPTHLGRLQVPSQKETAPNREPIMIVTIFREINYWISKLKYFFQKQCKNTKKTTKYRRTMQKKRLSYAKFNQLHPIVLSLSMIWWLKNDPKQWCTISTAARKIILCDWHW